VIARDSRLLPGARLLFAVIRQKTFGDGRCLVSDAKLALAIGMKERVVRKYCTQLVKLHYLKQTHRHGQTPIRELLSHPAFFAPMTSADRHELEEQLLLEETGGSAA